MDDPQLGAEDHVRALRGLSRIYRASRTGHVIWDMIAAEARAAARPVRVLDIATGGGDLPLDLARRARTAGVAMQITGCDVSPTAVTFARERAERERLAVNFIRLDVLREPLPDAYDVLTTGLFLHHLARPEAVDLLRRMGAAAGRAVLVDDLRRSRTGLWLAWLATRVLSRSPIVRTDGPLSVRAAFTPLELGDLARDAGLEGADIRLHWPQRQLLVWRKK
jgi:2-polyprenyl-3-methyl-5-hydroxy-6-metoxy-1,4-benzoquinol methylase